MPLRTEIATGSSKAEWGEILRAWGKVLDEYEQHGQPRGAKKRELGYCNTERANVGFLLSAAYRDGGVGIAEYTHKTTRGGLALVDLWIKSVGQASFVCEAKQRFLRDPEKLAWCVDRLLEAADYEVGELKGDGSFDKRASIAFVVPFATDTMKSWEDKWRKKAKDVAASALYWSATHAPVPLGCRLSHPGIMVFIREWSEGTSLATGVRHKKGEGTS